MICIEGKTAFSGIAIGPIREFAKKSSAVRRSHVDDTAAECTRFEEAKKVAMEELGALYDKAVKEVGEDNAAIFEVHQMMLDDEDYCDSIRNIITTPARSPWRWSRRSFWRMIWHRARRSSLTVPRCWHL